MQSQQLNDAQVRRSTRRRQAALALVLALLAALAVAATASAYVATWTETTLDDFNSGTFSYTGLLDLPDEEIDSVQLLPVGLSGEWDTADVTLEEPLANLGAVAIGDRIYVVGGSDSGLNGRDEVYSLDVGSDGELAVPHLQDNRLPEARFNAGVTAYDPDGPAPVIYVVGGRVDTVVAAQDTVFRAPVTPSSGVVGEWVEDEDVRLPTAVEQAPAVVHEDSLYVIGGWDTKNWAVLDKVYRASIDTSGALGEFVELEDSSLPVPLFGGAAIVYDGVITDTLYLIGGRDLYSSTSKVYFADILENGELTKWTESEGELTSSGGTVPLYLYGHGGVYRRGEIILTGGRATTPDSSDVVSSTVKAALVDPTNTTLRLYDWCEDAPPDCTIGAWQSGALLPEPRALHGAAAVGDYLYVLGGQDGANHVRDTIYYGTVSGAGAVYAPEGKYKSDEMYLGQQAKLLQLEWDTTISRSEEMGLTMQYRYSLNGDEWEEWSAPVESVTGTQSIEIAGHPEDVAYFQYQTSLSTTVATASPLLNWVQLYYEVPDPDLEVIKDTESVIYAALGTPLTYTITYRNNGGWRAEDAVLTETLPENTTFAGSDSWQQVGTNQYTYQVGDVERNEVGTATFRVRVNDDVPPNTDYITNVVSIDYPPMYDALENRIIDPDTSDNEYEFSNPLSIPIVRAVDLTITDLVWEPGITVAGMWPTFCLTVTNVGNLDAMPLADDLGFWVELYIKPSSLELPPPRWPADHDWGYCLYEIDPTCDTLKRLSFMSYIGHLPAGDKVENLCFEPQAPEDPSALDFPVAGTYDIYAQVDVAFAGDDLYLGRYSEGNEENNVVQDSMILINADYHVHLPLILRSAP